MTLHLYQAIQATSEDYYVQNYSRQTNMYELHCQAINQKCVLDRHVSIKTAVLYGSVGSASLDTMYNVQTSLHLRVFELFQDQCKNVNA